MKRKKIPRKVVGGESSKNKKIDKRILIQGFTKIPNIIILDPALNCQDFRIITVLTFHSFYKSWCNPSHKTIAKESYTGISTVKRALLKLKDLGYIDWERKRSSNRYTLIWKKTTGNK